MEVDITDQLEDYARVQAENEAKAKHWATELDKLRRQHAGRFGCHRYKNMDVCAHLDSG